MPFTPLHLGPGAAIKSLAPRWFGFTGFALVQMVIDLEPLFYLATEGWPHHRLFHSYLGVWIPIVIVLLIGQPVCEWWLRIWSSWLSERQARYLGCGVRPTRVQIAVGTVMGGLSHVALDSVMHADIRPFAPFSEGGSLLGMVTLSHLQLFCIVTGVVGVGLLLVYRLARPHIEG